MKSKLRTLQDAIADHVHDGDTVALEGFTHLIPFAAGHEIIRQRRRDLTLVRMTPDIIADQMIAAGVLSKLIFAFAGNSSVGSLYHLRRAIEGEGSLEIEEYSHFGILARYQAGAANLPFMPIKSYAGSDLPRVNHNLRKLVSPYDGSETYVVPPMKPDVAIIHCQRGDEFGNVQSWGILGPQQEAAFAARRTIAVVEEIVDSAIIRSDPNRTIVPGFVVDAICEAPYGAHPGFAQGYYDRDNEFYRNWPSVSKDPEKTAAWLDEWVYGVSDRAGYVEKLGVDFFAELTPQPVLSDPVSYGSVA